MELVRRAQPLLGTYVVISAYTSHRAETQTALSEAFDEIRRVDGLMSIHRSDTELTRLNQNGAGKDGVKVSRELYDVIAMAQSISRKTDGAFDITIRPLADLWGFIWKEYRLPTQAELDDVLPRMGWEGVIMNPRTRRIRLDRKGLSLDLGGIAKGYAVDCAVDLLKKKQLTAFMVRAGGDLRVVGAPPGQAHWEVQLEDPEKKGRRVLVPLRDAALSTSGNYENYFEIDGKRYGHLLNPRTGLPVQSVAACSVVGSTCLETDAWATAFLVYGAERSLREFGGQFGIRMTVMSDLEGEPGDAPASSLKVTASPLFPEPL